MKLFRAVMLVCIMGSCHGQNNTSSLKTNIDNNTLLWEISGKGIKSPSYLFGTFHLMCKDQVHLGESLKKALKNSKELYLEMDMDDPALLLSAFTLMNMNKGEKLADLYSPADYQRVEDFFRDSLQSSLTLFEHMKPAFLEAMLYPKMMPCKTITGVEEELMKLAKDNKQEIQGLETMAFQASVFDSIPYPDQAKELLKTIDSINSYKKYFDTMTRIYQQQQLKEIENMFSKTEFGMEENQDILLNNRNKNWVSQLRTIMKKEPVFIAVGAGHLVGEKGVIELLRKEGYTVRPIENVK